MYSFAECSFLKKKSKLGRLLYKTFSCSELECNINKDIQTDGGK